jgi:hypothetical protein
MTMRDQAKLVWTPPHLNTLLGVLGLAIIWLATHNWVAVLGGVVAGLHFQITIKEPEQ